MEETFTYDNMNRLTGITLTRPSGSDLHCNVTYTGSNKEALHYVLKDNLGSWTTITAGNSFDKPMFDRGYTGHEHLTDFGLVNMNGRMYDPVMSSFLSADRFVQNPLAAQGFNRYAYCMNNPLRFVDPTGWEYVYGGGYGGYPRTVTGLIQDYLSDPCYITRQQLIEAGIYDIEGGYGFYGGGGTMDANWMEGDGSVHHSSWSVRTESGGFNAGAWAIPYSFNPMWENQCQGFCDYGYNNYDNISQYVTISVGSILSYNNVQRYVENTFEKKELPTDLQYSFATTSSVTAMTTKAIDLSKEMVKASQYTSKIGQFAKYSKMIGYVGPIINTAYNSYLWYDDQMSSGEFLTRTGVTAIEVGLTHIPVHIIGEACMIGSIVLTAYDVCGGFDNTWYNDEWRNKKFHKR